MRSQDKDGLTLRDTAGGDADLRFDAILHPHRSLGPAGFFLVIFSIAAISLTAGIGFMLAGAWPVIGFCGLEILAVWFAFRHNFKSGRMLERVELRPDRLDIWRHHPNGRTESWQLQPYWARIHYESDPRTTGRLHLRSHGEELELGGFLTAEEKESFAEALDSALKDLRNKPMPA